MNNHLRAFASQSLVSCSTWPLSCLRYPTLSGPDAAWAGRAGYAVTREQFDDVSISAYFATMRIARWRAPTSPKRAILAAWPRLY
jgi:hypothetical protein